MNNSPIGILDSGVGGLTVWREIIRELPHESTVYIADSQNTPYGAKTPEEIYHLSKRLVEFLLEKKAKLIVVACNTITVSCLDQLRRDYPLLPMIGTVPVIKTAVEKTRNGNIGILATTRTAESSYQQALIQKFAKDCQVCNIGTDQLVPLIEQGIIEGEQIDRVLTEVLLPFKEHAVDTIALGCTHYPFVRDAIQSHVGSTISLLDSGAAIARQVRRVIEHNDIQHHTGTANYDFYTTGKKEVLERLVTLLAPKDLPFHLHSLTL